MQSNHLSTVELARHRSTYKPSLAFASRAKVRPVVLQDDRGHPYAYALSSAPQFECNDSVPPKPLNEEGYSQALNRMKAFMAGMLEQRSELGLSEARST